MLLAGGTPAVSWAAVSVFGEFQSAEGSSRTYLDVGGVWDGSSQISPNFGDTLIANYYNAGPNAASEIEGTITAPAGILFAANGTNILITGSSPACGVSVPTPIFSVSGQTASFSFSPSFDLPVGCTLVFETNVYADNTAMSGTYSATLNTSYLDGPMPTTKTGDFGLFVLGAGLLVDKSLAAGQSKKVVVGDMVDFSILVTNPGPGAIFDVEIEDVGTSGLPFVAYNPAGLPPSVTFAGNLLNIPYMAPNEVVNINLQSEVMSCLALDNTASGTELSGLHMSEGSESVEIDLETPLIELTYSDPFSLQFDQTTQIVIDVASSGLGDAVNLEIETNLASMARIVSVASPDWTFNAGVFTYVPGTLPNNNSSQLIVNVEPLNHCTSLQGALNYVTLVSNYVDQCQNSYVVPAQVMQLRNLTNAPDAEVSKSMSPRRIEFGDQGSFTLTAHLENYQWLEPMVTVTDVLPSNLESFGSISPPAGTSISCNGSTNCQPGDTLIWSIDPTAISTDTL
ncbi:MAG: hypothetical protein ACPGWM_08705, partial [Flavobacteriales bacterium]